jgi:hypothetical protein
MLPDQHRYYRLDLKPEVVQDGDIKYTKKEVQWWGPKQIFAETDLYTTQWGTLSNTEIEQYYFGKLYQRGNERQIMRTSAVCKFVKIARR